MPYTGFTRHDAAARLAAHLGKPHATPAEQGIFLERFAYDRPDPAGWIFADRLSQNPASLPTWWLVTTDGVQIYRRGES